MTAAAESPITPDTTAVPDLPDRDETEVEELVLTELAFRSALASADRVKQQALLQEFLR